MGVCGHSPEQPVSHRGIETRAAHGLVTSASCQVNRTRERRPFTTCIRRLSQNRPDLYGCCEEEDVEVLLLLYCRVIAETQPGIE